MTANATQTLATEILANLEGFLKKFRVTKENEKDREILTLANLDSGYIRKFIVKKVDERSLFRRRSSQKSLKDENENKSRRKSKLRNGDLKKVKRGSKDDRRHSTGSLDSVKSNASQKSTFSLRHFGFGSTTNLKSSKKNGTLKPERKCKSSENLRELKKKKKKGSDYFFGRLNFGFGSSSESEDEQEDLNGQIMTVKQADEKSDPGVVNPAFIGEEDLEDEGVDLGKDKEVFGTGRSEGDGMSDTDSVCSQDSASSEAETKFNPKMSPRPLRRSRKKRSPQQSPESFRSSYQSNRSSVCSTRKGILKKAASSTTLNLEMNNISQPQTPTENGHTSKFTDPFEDCENGDAPKFVRSTDETGLQHQRSFNRVKFILDSGRPDNVTGDYDDIKIEQKNERSSDRSKSLPNKEDSNGISRSGRKCLIFAAGLLVLTLAVILGSLFGSHKLNNYALKGAPSPLDDKFIRNAIEGRFKITNKDFTDDLHNYESDEFKKMSKDLEALIAKVIYHEATPNQANSTVTLRIIKILKGSIVPIFRIKWTNKDLLDDSEIRMRILRHLDKFGSIGEYKVDKTSVTVSSLQNLCHKSLSDCSHTCIFSTQTLKFLCRCPDTLVLTNNTICTSPQQTTRKTPFIVPPVVNDIIKGSGAQFHSVNPETVEKKTPEGAGETVASEEGTKDSKDAASTNKTIAAEAKNSTTTVLPSVGTTKSPIKTEVVTEEPIKETTIAKTTISSVVTNSSRSETEQISVTTTTEQQSGGQDIVEETHVTQPTSSSMGEAITTATPIDADRVEAQDNTELVEDDNAEHSVIPEENEMDGKIVVTEPSTVSTTNKTSGDTSSQSVTSFSVTEETIYSSNNVTEETTVNKNVAVTDAPPTSDTGLPYNQTTKAPIPTDISNTTEFIDTMSNSSKLITNKTYEVTTELIPSSSTIETVISVPSQKTSIVSTSTEPATITHVTNNETLTGTNQTTTTSSSLLNATSVELTNVTNFHEQSETNGTLPEKIAKDNKTSVPEVVTVQAIPLASLPTTTTTTTTTTSTTVSQSSTSESLPVVFNNTDNADSIPIGVIADVSNSLSFGDNEPVQSSVDTENAMAETNSTVDDAIQEPVQPKELCSDSEFECETGTSRFGKCIPKSSQCDSVYDCYDQSDEKSCIENKCMENYQCWSGDCIQRKFVCDGIRHCPDGGDEEGCETWKCSDDEFKCTSRNGTGKVCIPIELQCDGQADCAEHTDEKGCDTECSKDQFLCSEGWCIPNQWQCDGTPDCTGGEDEQDCDCRGLDQSPCAVGGCVPTFKLCDGLRQCPDGSDEYGCLEIDNITKQLQVRSEEKRWSAVCGDKWTAGWTELVCEQLGLGEAESTEVRVVNESVPKPRVRLSPDAPQAAQRGRAPLQYFLTPGECSMNPLVHVSCKHPVCGKWTQSTSESSSINSNPSWPSMGLLIQPGSYDDINMAFSHSCAATLITPAWAIASYSCLSAKPNGFEPDKWAFLIGESSPRVGQRKTQLRHAKQVVVYPGAKRKNGLWVGDAVLLRLQSSIKLDDATQLACLADKKVDTHSHCKIITWVENKKENEGGLVQHIQKLPLPNLTVNTCNNSYYGGQLESEHVCASFVQPSHSPCNGNEGSPLMCQSNDGSWQLQGLLSVTSTCARFDLPSLFTDISSINQWILNTVERSASVSPTLETPTTTTTLKPSVTPPVARSAAHRAALKDSDDTS